MISKTVVEMVIESCSYRKGPHTKNDTAMAVKLEKFYRHNLYRVRSVFRKKKRSMDSYDYYIFLETKLV